MSKTKSESAAAKDPLILAVETATRAGSVAVARGARILSSKIGDASVSHSAHLMLMIQQALNEAGAKLSDIELFAASSGPGSFTGLRIGLATVKALANCTSRKVVGVSTLAAVAHASGARGAVVALLPAGRGEVFAQMFSVEQGSVQTVDAAAHLSPRALLEKYGGVSELTFAGEGAIQQYELLQQSNSKWTILQDGNDNLAPAIATLAILDDSAGKSVTAEHLHAVYVRPSDAEINERWQPQKPQQ